MLTLGGGGGLDCTALTNRNIFSVQPIHSMIEETKFVLARDYAKMSFGLSVYYAGAHNSNNNIMYHAHHHTIKTDSGQLLFYIHQFLMLPASYI